MRVSSRMKRFRDLATLAVTAGFVAFLAFTFRASEMPVHAAAGPMSPAAQAAAPASLAPDPGSASYEKHCAICHGEQREGILPAFPPLIGIKRQMTDAQMTDLIHTGKGRMPGFPTVSNEELAALLNYLGTTPAITPQMSIPAAGNRRAPQLTGEAAAGSALFQQNCAFCHGRDAMGCETGPDLTRSKLVLSDVNGSKIGQVMSEGRTNGDKKMPAFRFSGPETSSLAAFIHARVAAADAMKGGRRGVEVSDLQTGNAEAGKLYF